MNPSQKRLAGISFLTAMAVGCLAWITRALGHEVIGHGGACLLVGDTPLGFSAMYFHGTASTTLWAGKVRLAGGTIYNVLTAVICVGLLAKRVKARSWLAYFLWVTAVMSLLQGGSYVAFGRYVHSGTDWAQFLLGIEPAWLWNAAEWIVGLGLIGAGIVVARRFESRFLPSSASRRDKHAIYLIPYLAAILVSVSASLAVPSDQRALMVLGGFGNSFTFMLPMLVLPFLRSQATSAETVEGSFGERNPSLVLAGITCALMFVLIVGPGITF